MRQMEQIQENCRTGGKTKRLANFELLRCIAMMMVVVLHFLGKNGILAPLSQASLAGYEYLAWGVESLCIVAVNVYLLHCHTALDERWQQWIFAITGRPDSVGSLLLGILLAVLFVFTAGICADMVRAWLFWGLERAFSGIRGGQRKSAALRGDKDGNEEK